MFQLKEAEKSEFLLPLPFVLCRPSKDYMMLIHTGEGSLLNPPTQVLISSRDILQTHPEVTFNLGNLWPVKLTNEIKRGTEALSEAALLEKLK